MFYAFTIFVIDFAVIWLLVLVLHLCTYWYLVIGACVYICVMMMMLMLFMSSAVDQERIRPVGDFHWVESLLWVHISALKLLFEWQERHLVGSILVPLILKDSLPEEMEEETKGDQLHSVHVASDPFACNFCSCRETKFLWLTIFASMTTRLFIATSRVQTFLSTCSVECWRFPILEPPRD